ncbi:unnamed protein product [Urochloa humidicola]
MASINFSLAVAVLISVEPSEAVCTLMCAQGTYITCANSPGQNFTGSPAASARRRAVPAASSNSPAARPAAGLKMTTPSPASLVCLRLSV